MEKIKRILKNIKSKDLEAQMMAIVEFEDIVRKSVKVIAEELQKNPNRYLFAERLSNIGYILCASLEKVFNSEKEGEAKDLSALLLFKFGSDDVCEYLINLLNSERESANIAAEFLAKRGVVEAVNPIITRIEKAKIEEIDLIVALIEALKTLNQPLPIGLINRFKSADTPWQIKSLIESE